MIIICCLFSFWSISKECPLVYLQSILHPRYPPILPPWMRVLFIFHVQFKWCTPVLQNWKCSFANFRRHPLVIFTLQPPLSSCSSFFPFSSASSILTLFYSVAKMRGCHTGDNGWSHPFAHSMCVRDGTQPSHMRAQAVEFPPRATLMWILRWAFIHKQMTDPKNSKSLNANNKIKCLKLSVDL